MKNTRIKRLSFKESFRNLWSEWAFKGMLLFGLVILTPLCINGWYDGGWQFLIGYGVLIIFTVLYSWLKRGA